MKNGFLWGVILMITILAGWVTHILWAISTLTSSIPATGGQIAFSVIGALAAPVGTIHGFLLWFGFGL
jgi:hypothetical protein